MPSPDVITRTGTTMKLSFSESDDGILLLENQSFVDEVFHDLVINPPRGSSATVSNTKFLNCRTSPGTCIVGPLVTLDTVEFSNLDCGDAIHIDAAATLNQVTIRGSQPERLGAAGFVFD